MVELFFFSLIFWMEKFCFDLLVLLHANLLLVIEESLESEDTELGGEESEQRHDQKVEGNDVHTEVLQEIQLPIIDLEVVKVPELHQKFQPVDRLVKARPVVRSPHVGVPVHLRLVLLVPEYLADGGGYPVLVEVVPVQCEPQASLLLRCKVSDRDN